MAPARRRGKSAAAGTVLRRPGCASDAHQAALLASDERFRLATEPLAGFLYDWDLTTGRIEQFGGMGDVLGFRLDEVPPGTDWWIERIHPDEVSRVMQVANGTFSGRATSYHYEYRVRHRQGHYIHILDRGRIIRDDSGAAARVLGGVVDVSDRKRAEEALHASEERFRLAAEALAGFLYEWDTSADEVQCFGRSKEFLGFSAAELSGDGAWWRSRLHPDDAPAAAELREQVLNGDISSWVMEYRIQHRDGHYVDVANSGRLVRDATGRVTRVIGGISDITERRLFEKERGALLEKERVARAAAEAATRSRDELLSVVYHDLRAPLSTIAICASALAENREPTPKSIREIAGAIHRSTDWMQRLIRDLLDVANIQGAGLTAEFRAELPGPILEAIAELFEQEARNHGVLLETQIPPLLPRMRADGDRVLQALANLMNNALKFTEPGGRITLRADPEPGGICFSVEDTGMGISAEDLPHIFDRYRHKHSDGGRGLGLAIVKGIVNAHGGRVDVESTPGKGSRFSFAIPTAPG